jgi:DNA repair exonuclease SbcCD ATPase subunit
MPKIRKIFRGSNSKPPSDYDGSDVVRTEEPPNQDMDSTSSSAKLHSSPVTAPVIQHESPSPPPVDLEPILQELKESREETSRLQEELNKIKSQFQSDSTLLQQSLQEERFRFERLEEQMNDLIELHQNEIENMKQGIDDLDEKIQYQVDERLRDVYEMIESSQTRISRMEHTHNQHLQQLVNLDSLDNSNARALVLKMINVLLTILQVILLLVATVAGIITPFLQTRYVDPRK